MAQVRLSREDLSLIDFGIRVLQEKRGIENTAIGNIERRLESAGLQLNISGPNAVLLDVDVVAMWREIVGAMMAAGAMYASAHLGIQARDELPAISQLADFEAGASLEELIQARNELEQALFDAGAL
jgi:hypothetical protein